MRRAEIRGEETGKRSWPVRWLTGVADGVLPPVSDNKIVTCEPVLVGREAMLYVQQSLAMNYLYDFERNRYARVMTENHFKESDCVILFILSRFDFVLTSNEKKQLDTYLTELVR